jgi:hypothetical protein
MARGKTDLIRRAELFMGILKIFSPLLGGRPGALVFVAAVFESAWILTGSEKSLFRLKETNRRAYGNIRASF